jgi:membrane protease YdiL (CAAX protease family)
VADSPSQQRASRQVRSAIRPSVAPPSVDAATAVATFVVAWTVAQIVAAIVLGLAGADGSLDTIPIGTLAASLAATWAVYLGGMWYASTRSGTGAPAADYGVVFSPVDVLGLGLGVLSQLVIVNLVYLPLEAIWPDTFSEDRLQETAQDLADRASGATTLLLFALVVLAAPVVEELFYRGLLQRSLLGRFNDAVVVVGVAAVFALVHFRPVEYPGLFVFGLVLGLCAQRTGRLGLAITTHIGFNATGLLLVL